MRTITLLRRAGIVACAAIGLSFASCALLPSARNSTDLLVYQAKKKKFTDYKKAEFGSPADHTLAFGSASVRQIYMTQLDPRYPPVHAALGVAGTLSKGFLGMEQYNVFYAPPVAVGSKMQTTYYFFSVTMGRTTYLYRIERPINLHDQFAYVAVKPGLLYLGDFVATDHFSSDTGLSRKGQDSELSCLKKLLTKFRKTEWEPVIKARIEELSK